MFNNKKTCPTCDGVGEMRCANHIIIFGCSNNCRICHGKGYVRCRRCNGSGKVTNKR